MADQTIQSPDVGAPLRMSLKVSDGTHRMFFSQKDWNDLVRYALDEAGWWWMANYMPLRFTWYARSAGIYTGAKRKGMPLIKTGRLQQHIFANARVESRATSGNSYIDLILPSTQIIKDRPDGKGPLNYKDNPVVAVALSTITDREIRGMAKEFDRVLQQGIDDADKHYRARGPNSGSLQRLTLSSTQRETMASARVPRQSRKPSQRRVV